MGKGAVMVEWERRERTLSSTRVGDGIVATDFPSNGERGASGRKEAVCIFISGFAISRGNSLKLACRVERLTGRYESRTRMGMSEM